MDILTYDVPLWGVLLYFLIASAIGALEAPTEKNGPFYRWFFSFANHFAANFTRAAQAFKKNGNGNGQVETK